MCDRQVRAAAVAVGVFLFQFGSLTSVVSAQPAPSPWPMRGRDAQHSGVGAAPGPAQTPGVLWQRSIGGGESSPVLAPNGDVLIGTDHGISRLSRSGGVVWDHSFAATTYAAPAIAADGTIYCSPLFNATSGLGLFALNPDGTTKWQYTNLHDSARTLASPVIGNDGTAYFAVANDGIYAFNPDGTRRWYVPTGRYYIGSPALSRDGSTLYVGDDSFRMSALDAFTGTSRWDFSTRTRSSPAVAPDGTIYLGTDNGSVLALNPDGTQKWQRFFGSSFNEFFMSPVIAPDGTIVIGSTESVLYAFNPDGSTRWSLNGHYSIGSPGLDPAGNIYLAEANFLSSFTIDGQLRWQLPAGESTVCQTVVGNDGRLYYTTGDTTGSKLVVVPEPSAIGFALLLGFLRIIRRRS